MLGYAASTDVRNVPMVVVDQDCIDREPRAHQPVRRVAEFLVVDSLSSPAEVDAYLDGGRAWMAMVDPGRLRRRASGAGRPTTVQVVADGTDANSTNVALGYAGTLVAGYARELAALRAAARSEPLISAEIRVWFNPQLESRRFHDPRHPGARAARGHRPTSRRWRSCARRSSARSSS